MTLFIFVLCLLSLGRLSIVTPGIITAINLITKVCGLFDYDLKDRVYKHDRCKHTSQVIHLTMLSPGC